MVYTCSAILFSLKKKGSLTHVRTWMNLEDIKLSEISKLQKDRYCVILLYQFPRVGQFRQEVEFWMSGAGGKGSDGVSV